MKWFKDTLLWVAGLVLAFFSLVGLTYFTGTLPEILGVTGPALGWWRSGLLIFLTGYFCWAFFWVLFHPRRTRLALVQLIRWLWRKIRPQKPQPITAEAVEAEVTPPVQPIAKPKATPLPPIGRRRFLIEGTALAAFSADAFFIEPSNYEVTRLDIKIPNLPPAFEGFVIAQISDIHIDPYTTAEDVARTVALVNSQKPDLTVVTGDFVSRGTYYFDMAAQTLGQLRDGAKLGVYGTTGNHDHWADGDDLGRLEPLLKRHGLPLLRNTATELKLNGDSLWLLGTDDSSTHHADWDKTLRAAGISSREAALKDERPKILLSHNPNFIDQAATARNTLMLSGHTHGAQIYVPGLMDAGMWPFFHHWRGYYRQDDFQLYVNNGFGVVGPPARFLARPEIVFFKLLKA